MGSPAMHPLALALAVAGLLLAPSAGNAEEAAGRRPVALIAFDYQDTSGEVRDQTAEHQARLKHFMAALERDLAASPTLRIVTPICDPAPCRFADGTVTELAAAARRAGAQWLLVGGIHKMSTLVQWAKIELIDLASDRVIYDRLYTFRGDTDESWQRAESFIAGEIRALPPG